MENIILLFPVGIGDGEFLYILNLFLSDHESWYRFNVIELEWVVLDEKNAGKCTW